MKALGITFSLLVILSVFFPWAETYSIHSELNNVPYNVKFVYGFSNGLGLFGLILGIISLLMFYYERKLSLLPGYTIVFIGIIFLLENSKFLNPVSSSYSNSLNSIDYIFKMKIGIYLFLISGILCVISGIKFLRLDSKFWTFS